MTSELAPSGWLRSSRAITRHLTSRPYANADRLPFTVRVGKRTLRFDESKLARWQGRRAGDGAR